MNSLQVNLPGREYKIDIGLNILESQLPQAVLRNGTDHVVVVTNTTLQELYPACIFDVLANFLFEQVDSKFGSPEKNRFSEKS